MSLPACEASTHTFSFDQLFTHYRPGDFTFAMIKPDAFAQHREEAICSMILEAGLGIHMERDQKLTSAEVRALYYEHVGKFFYERNEKFIMSGTSRLLLLTGQDAQRVWRDVLMPQVRGRWGQFNTDPEMKHLNLVHGSDNWNNAFREVQFFFA